MAEEPKTLWEAVAPEIIAQMGKDMDKEIIDSYQSGIQPSTTPDGRRLCSGSKCPMHNPDKVCTNAPYSTDLTHVYCEALQGYVQLLPRAFPCQPWYQMEVSKAEEKGFRAGVRAFIEHQHNGWFSRVKEEMEEELFQQWISKETR